MGKTIDMSSLILQNEHVRAVGNMNVNARGDVLDSSDRVIDQKNRQVQRQYNRQIRSNVKDLPLHASTREAQAMQKPKVQEVLETVLDTMTTPVTVAIDTPAAPAPETTDTAAPVGGLAAAMAKVTKNHE